MREYIKHLYLRRHEFLRREISYLYLSHTQYSHENKKELNDITLVPVNKLSRIQDTPIAAPNHP